MNRKLGPLWLLPILLGGCAQLPTEQALPKPTAQSWQQELSQMQVEPISGPLTLNEAIARGLKYNLDRRAKQLELEIASGQFESALQEMINQNVLRQWDALPCHGKQPKRRGLTCNRVAGSWGRAVRRRGCCCLWCVLCVCVCVCVCV